MNSVNLIGRLTADPELKTTTSGKSVTSFSIAVNKDRDNVDYFDIVAWNKTAELITKHFRKGSQIGIEGRLNTRKWEDNNGNKRKAVEVVVNSITFCGKKEDGGAPGTSYSAPQATTAAPPDDFSNVDLDDELPF